MATSKQLTIFKRNTDQGTMRFHVTAPGRAMECVGETWKKTEQSHVTVGIWNSTSVGEKTTQAFSSSRVTQEVLP